MKNQLLKIAANHKLKKPVSLQPIRQGFASHKLNTKLRREIISIGVGRIMQTKYRVKLVHENSVSKMCLTWRSHLTN